MFIKDLQPRQTDVDVEGEVLELSDVREFNKFGKAGKVANAIIKDGTGRVKLSLWNEQIDKVKVSDKVKVTKGYVGEFQGELQLTTGKFGTLEIIKGEAPAVEKKEETKVKTVTEVPSTDLDDDDDVPEDETSETEEEYF